MSYVATKSEKSSVTSLINADEKKISNNVAI